MGTSVYCSATHIKLVEGSASGKKIRITAYESYPLPEGVLINGMITDEDAVATALKEMAKERKLQNKSVALVVDSSNITLRTLTAPLLSKKEVLAFARQELSLYQEQDADIVYDYAVLTPKLEGGGGSILAAAASRSFFESYLSVFRTVGMKVSGINIGVNCQVKLARLFKAQVEGAYILAHVDGNNLLLTLFEGGRYLLANRYRLLFTFGSQGWFHEFADHVSSVIQFNKGQKGNKDIAAVYIDGLHSEARETIASGLAAFHIQVLPFPQAGAIEVSTRNEEEFQLGKYQYNVGNLLKN